MSDTSQKTYMLNMGPQHPAMHGVVRLILELQGEKIVDADVEIGYLHRAFEKHSESETWNNVVPWTDRLNYVSPLINNVGYAMAVEKLGGIEVPERGQYIRVIACEMSRVTDHLTCVGASAMELGAFTVFLYMIKAREYLYQMVDTLTGARITTAFTRVGGVKSDLPPGFAEKFKEVAALVREAVRESDVLLTKNRIFMDRMEGTGAISKEDALAYGITGPFLRSTGVAYDVRRSHPYAIYGKLDFEIPVGTKGDNYDRYLVRMAEIEQSLRLIEQCLEKIPAGKHSLEPKEIKWAYEIQDAGKFGDTALLAKYQAKVDQTLEGMSKADQPDTRVLDRKITLPPKESTYTNIEGLMNHFELVMWSWGVKIPPSETYFAVEGGNGELGFHLVSDGSDGPYRVRCRPPCLFPMAALKKLLIGGQIADIIPTFGSVNMIAGELDR
ncbi:MAG: NADH-quinone oxidoreductase subunit D [Elusimicrobiota bacterium]|nr:MAG: NADH-quinone oxidoreductase subunit D [Elusimicrobiota bacterium]